MARRRNVRISFTVIDTASDSIDEILPPGISPRDHEILVRHYVYKDTSDEIGKDLAIKPSTVRQRLARLRKKIKKELN